MNKKIGFIGLGKMAKAIIRGIFYQNPQAKIFGYDPFAQIENVEMLSSNKEVAEKADIIFICTKPFVIKDVLEEIKTNLTDDKLVVSIAAGISLSILEASLNKNQRIIRIMPNTPALVGQGAFALSKGQFATREDIEIIKNLLSDIGTVIEQPEDKMDIITALSGSGPAFYYFLIDKMAKGAVKLGLDYETALKLSAQTALGSAKMILNSDMSVEDLITAVTTKGGCTEVGNNILNSSNIAGILDKTIKDTAIKAEQLGKN